MYILLIIWFIFLFAYIIFNVYGLFQVMAKRFRGDAMGFAVLIYLVAMFLIIAVSILVISQLNWGQGLGGLIKI